MRHLFILFTALIFLSSCGSTDTKTNERVEAVRAQIATGKPPVFNPALITREEKQMVLVDINRYVSDLNRIIFNREYSKWVQNLEPKFMQRLESKENLELASKSDRLVKRGVKLTSLLDYFYNVVVPSRASLRVDDIEFISETRVKAFMIEGGQRR